MRESWLDDLPEQERQDLYDAGRIGKGRFEGPDKPPLYARHHANPDMTLLVVKRYGTAPFSGQGERALLLLPGLDKDKRWMVGELFMQDGVQIAAYINEYGTESEARFIAETREP